MYEKKFKALAPQALTANGTSIGSLKIADPGLVKVKQKIRLSANTLPDLDLEIKRVEEDGTIFVGEVSKPIDNRTDISAYTIALSAAISWPEDQKRPNITADEFERAVYEEEPTVAKRVVLVDKLGNKIDNVRDDNGVNRLAVDGQFSAEVDVQVDVDVDGVYDPITNPDPDNIGLIGHTRNVNPTQVDQIQRITTKQGSVNTDTRSMDVAIHDHLGNAFTPENPFPVGSTTSEKFFTLIAASKWMELATYDEVVPSTLGNVLTLKYYEDGAFLGEAIITNYASPNGWNLKLNRYIDDDDGTQLLDDNDIPLNLD